MNRIVLAAIFPLCFTLLFPQSARADEQNECVQKCEALKKACNKAAKQTCHGDLFCILGEREDCKAVRDDCLENCPE